MNKVSMIASPELLCSKLVQDFGNSENFKKDPRGYIFSRTNVELGDGFNLNVVENTDSLVNLALPYYKGISV